MQLNLFSAKLKIGKNRYRLELVQDESVSLALQLLYSGHKCRFVPFYIQSPAQQSHSKSSKISMDTVTHYLDPTMELQHIHQSQHSVGQRMANQ